MSSNGERLYSKVRRHLIPFMFVLYVVAYLDRINVGFAALQLNADLGFSDSVFGLGSGIFFVGYFLFEVPSNIILHRVGPRIWIARILVTWGLVSSAMMFVSGVWSFYALRLLLGIAEAGFFPGMILYLTYWFPLEARGRAVASFMTATAIAGVVGGPLSGALLRMDGILGLQGWQWLFLIEGFPAVVLGFITWRLLPDGPDDAAWLTSEEKDTLKRRLVEERRTGATPATPWEALRKPRFWLVCLPYFAIVTSFYGVSFWLPQILRGLGGLSDFGIGLLSAVPYAIAAVTMVWIGRHSDARDERRWHVALSAIGGAMGLLLSSTGTPVIAMLGLCIAAAGIWGTLGPYWALASAGLSGTTAAVGIALINSIGNLGGFLGPYAVGFLRERTESFAAPIVLLAGFLVLAAVATLFVDRKAVQSGSTPR